MLLLLVLILVDFGSSYTTKEEKCYGSDFDFPFHFTPPLFKGQIFYKPKGEEQKLVVNKGESKHQRFKVSYGTIKMKDLTEQDDGAVLYFGQQIIILQIKDCQEPEISSYGSSFSWSVPYSAQYLEFSHTPPSSDSLKPEIIWNRTDLSIGRGKVKSNYYEINNLKQKDSGYYRFRGRSGELIKWKTLKVQEQSRNLDHKEGDYLDMDFHFPLSHIIFTPVGSQSKRTLQKNYMNRRGEIAETYFSIRELKSEDAGTYEFIDKENYLALRVELKVMTAETPIWVYVVIVAGIVFGVLLCCCCVRKCCCKKSSNKRNSPAAVTDVYYHGSTQPTQPVMPLLSREPRVIAPDPPTYAGGGNMDPPPPTQVTVTGGLGPTSFSSTSYDFTTSDSEPKFELKGTTFPSASPLSSHTHILDVYTSDKLNFL